MNFNEIKRLAIINPNSENLMKLGAAYLREQSQEVVRIFVLSRVWWDSHGHGYHSLQIFVNNEEVDYLPPEYKDKGLMYRIIEWINENLDYIPYIDPDRIHNLEEMGIDIKIVEAYVGRKRDM